MDHISRIALKAVHFCTDDNVIFFSPARQSLQSFTLVSSPGHHVGKNPLDHYTFTLPEDILKEELRPLNFNLKNELSS